MKHVENYFRLLFVISLVALLSACGCSSSGGSSSPPPTSTAIIAAIEISFANNAIPVGVKTQAYATAIYDDNTRIDITNESLWLSQNNTVSVSSTGEITAVAAGTSTISAVYKSTISGSATFTVTSGTLQSISITPVAPKLPQGYSQTLTATGIFFDGSTYNAYDLTTLVSWSSNDAATASVSSTGLLSGVTANSSATITATLDGISDSITATITSATLSRIEITAPSLTLPLGLSLPFVATGVFNDDTTLDLTSFVSWSSANTAVATVSSTGLVKAVAVGSTQITASLNSIPGFVTIDVANTSLSSIEITPINSSIPIGIKQPFSATGHYDNGINIDLTTIVSWITMDSSIAKKTNTAGEFEAMAAGTTQISASLNSITALTGLTVTDATLFSITLSPLTPTIANGTGIQFTATGLYSSGPDQDITNLAIWDSSDPVVAKISNLAGQRGYATALSTGPTNISAIFGGVTSTSTILTVSAATLTGITVSGSGSMDAGAVQQLTATGTFSDTSTQDITSLVTWSSSNTTVATVSNAAGSKGQVDAHSAGTANIVASLPGVDSPAFTITVINNPNTPISASITATPNVIQNDGIDFSVVEITLHPAGGTGGTIADTPVNVAVSEGNTPRPLYSLTTTNGSASLTLASDYNGYISIVATEPVTGVSGSASILSTPSFSNSISSSHYSNIVLEGGKIASGSTFTLRINNRSNRSFNINNYVLKNATTTISTVAGSEISDGVLTAGESANIIMVSSGGAFTDNGITGRLTLTESATGQEFYIDVTFTP